MTAAREGVEWMPIDDAAKSGRPIVIYFGNSISRAWFKAAWLYTQNEEGPYWIDPDTGEQVGDDPTHYLVPEPLP